MKKWEIVLAIAGALLLGVSTWAIRRTEPPHRELILADAHCRTPITVIEPEAPKIAGSGVVFHGLSANRRIMEGLGVSLSQEGLRVYLIDLPGHGDNTDAFTFARAQECAAAAVESLTSSGQIDPKRTVLVGHSMGAAIAIRMADREPAAATIAISPAPMTLPRRMPANLLVFSAGSDLRMLKRQALELAHAAGGDRTGGDDFLQQRAFHLESVSYATHTSLLFDWRVNAESRRWIREALSPAARSAPEPGGSHLIDFVHHGRLVNGVAGSFAGLIGLLLAFPLLATVAARASGPAPTEVPGARPTLMLTEGAVCALAAALLLEVFVPLRFLHIYAGDYLASLLLAVGVPLLALNWKTARQSLPSDAWSILAAAALGLAVMLGIGLWLNWQIDDMWLDGPRWMRFAAILPVAWIFSFAEEVMLGPVETGRRRARRFGLFLALRAELWLACLLAYYSLASGQVLIVILVTFLTLFSILQRLATDALRIRTATATATAIFSAILSAWFIADVFPLT